MISFSCSRPTEGSFYEMNPRSTTYELALYVRRPAVLFDGDPTRLTLAFLFFPRKELRESDTTIRYGVFVLGRNKGHVIE